MLRVVKRAVLSQCWVHVNSSFYLRWRRIDAGADVWAICVEAREIRVHQRRESYPCHCVTRQILEQVLKLMFMSSDSIHDAVLCAEKRGRTPARSIDAALLGGSYTRNCDYLIINAVSLRHYRSVREVSSCSRILLQITSHGSMGKTHDSKTMNYNIATILAVIAILFVLLTYITGAPLVPVAVILLGLAIIFGGNTFRRV